MSDESAPSEAGIVELLPLEGVDISELLEKAAAVVGSRFAGVWLTDDVPRRLVVGAVRATPTEVRELEGAGLGVVSVKYSATSLLTFQRAAGDAHRAYRTSKEAASRHRSPAVISLDYASNRVSYVTSSDDDGLRAAVTSSVPADAIEYVIDHALRPRAGGQQRAREDT